MTIHEMKLAAAAKFQLQKAIVDTADADNRDLTDEEQSKYDALKTERAALKKRIDRAEELEREELALGVVDDAPHKPAPKGSADDKNPVNSAEYVAGFGAVMRARRYEVPGDAQAAMRIGTVDGSFAVPESYRNTIVEKMGTHNCLREICNVITTTSTENIPVVTDNGVAGWVDELGTYPESDLKGANKVLGAHKLGRICKLSEELISDSNIPIEQTVADAYAKSFGTAEEQAMFNGDGKSKPLGIVGQVKKAVTAALATAVSYDDFINVQHAIKRGYRVNAVWVLNDLTIAAARKLKNDKGEPIWQDGMREGEPDRLLGKPVYATDALSVPEAEAASVLFGDFKQCVDLGERGPIYMQRLEELYAAQGAIGIRAYQRVDCVVKDAEGIAKLVHPAA